MTGRGTPRVQPQSSSPDFFVDGIRTPAQGHWGYTLNLSGSQVLTSSYALYQSSSGFEFDLPYGVVRVGIIGLYTPAVAGGRMGLQVKWMVETGLASALLVKGATVVPAVSDPGVAEVDTYGAAIVTPVAAVPVLTPNRYVMPFLVPPLSQPFAVFPPPANEHRVRIRVYVREAGGGDPGTFGLEQIVAESFGEAQPFAQR